MLNYIITRTEGKGGKVQILLVYFALNLHLRPSKCTHLYNLSQGPLLSGLSAPAGEQTKRWIFFKPMVQNLTGCVHNHLPLWSHRWPLCFQLSPGPSRLLWIWTLDKRGRPHCRLTEESRVTNVKCGQCCVSPMFRVVVLNSDSSLPSGRQFSFWWEENMTWVISRTSLLINYSATGWMWLIIQFFITDQEAPVVLQRLSSPGGEQVYNERRKRRGAAGLQSQTNIQWSVSGAVRIRLLFSDKQDSEVFL